jgi:AcrR family transcriptional regulator
VIVDGRRAIGARNAAAILEAAIDVLNTEPDAGLAEVAAHAGVGRATLYRHYASREQLIAALRDHARAHMEELIASADLDGGDPMQAIERFVALLWEIRDRYGVLRPHDSPELEQRIRAFWAPLHGPILRAQRSGQIDAALAPDWVVSVLRAMLRAAIAEVEAGRLARADGPVVAMRTFVHGVSSGACPR